MKRPAATAHRSIRRHVLGGIAALIMLLAGVGGWASTTELSGAVVASGVLVVDSNVKKVQHPTGGVVGELHVRDGKRVIAGDIVVRLDDTVAIVARHTWAATQGLAAAAPKWDAGPNAKLSMADIVAQLASASEKPGCLMRWMS